MPVRIMEGAKAMSAVVTYEEYTVVMFLPSFACRIWAMEEVFQATEDGAC
jgi:hypothetical protein